MDTQKKVALLRENIKRQVNAFSERRKSNKRKAFALKITVTLLGCAVTIILGFQGATDLVLWRNIALVFSAFAVFFNTWDAFFNYRALWIRYTETASELRSLQADLEYLATEQPETIKKSEVDRIHAKYQAILNNTSRWWQESRQDENVPMSKSGT